MTKEEVIRHSAERRAKLVDILEKVIYEEMKNGFMPDKNFVFEDLILNDLLDENIEELKRRLEGNGFSVRVDGLKLIIN